MSTTAEEVRSFAPPALDPLGHAKLNYYLSDEGSGHLQYLDEFAWEHHVRGNYIMARRGWCPGACDRSKSLKQSYEYFLAMRMKGIRAHSWV